MNETVVFIYLFFTKVLTKLQGFTSTPVPLLREWDSIGSVADSGVDSKTVFTVRFHFTAPFNNLISRYNKGIPTSWIVK